MRLAPNDQYLSAPASVRIHLYVEIRPHAIVRDDAERQRGLFSHLVVPQGANPIAAPSPTLAKAGDGSRIAQSKHRM